MIHVRGGVQIDKLESKTSNLGVGREGNTLIEDTEAVELLIDLGVEKGYVNLDDILATIPQAEENVDLLDELFNALLSAGITYSNNGYIAGKQEEEESSPAKPVEIAQDDDPEEEYQNQRTIDAADAGDSIGTYLSQAARVPLLTRDEEVVLAMRIERGRDASRKLAKANGSAKKRADLIHLVEDGVAAREHLILANVRLVFSVAKKYCGRGMPLMDLVQEGHIGLMRAAKKFDYKRGYKFSTYATWWIRQAITRSVADQGRTIRLPVHMGERISKMYRVRHSLIQSLGRLPRIDELAEVLQDKPENVVKMLRFSKHTLSLELPVGEEDDAVLGDFIEDQEAPPPEDKTGQVLLKERMKDLLDTLPPREVRVLQLRFGLYGTRQHTLNEVGQKMGITRERVRQIQAQAIRRLRKNSLRREWVDYVRV
jgi:RNA polymerase primary sigma factor